MMGLVDSLFRKDARKFLKRKDSDAAEAGRALEELRCFLYNELKTSEGAVGDGKSWIHYAVAWILLAFFKSLSLLPMSPPSKSTPFSFLFSLGAVMAFASGLANTSLKHNSVGFYQMAKIVVTPTIVLAEFVLFKKTISSTKVFAGFAILVSALLGFLLQSSGAFALGLVFWFVA